MAYFYSLLKCTARAFGIFNLRQLIFATFSLYRYGGGVKRWGEGALDEASFLLELAHLMVVSGIVIAVLADTIM